MTSPLSIRAWTACRSTAASPIPAPPTKATFPSFKGRDLPLYSRQVATAGVRYEVDRWTYNLDAFAQSMQRAPGLSTDSQGNFTHNYITEPSADGQYGDIPGYVTWNARVGYDFARRRRT